MHFTEFWTGQVKLRGAMDSLLGITDNALTYVRNIAIPIRQALIKHPLL